MARTITRRRLLGHAAAASVALTLPTVTRNVLGANDRLNIACIGVGNRGHADLDGVRHENIVALCDIDDAFLGPASKELPKATTFHDYRVMLDKMHKQIDAVTVGTPDHTHAPATMAALYLKKHVYCEKPLTHTVRETRLVTAQAAASGVATQMGTQIHAGSNYRRVVELIQSGVIGDVRRVHTWVPTTYHGGDRPTAQPPIPKGLHWDLWLGVAPYRPYHPAYHPFKWRGWWHFGGGALADMACHHMDLPFWALGLLRPTSIEAHGPADHPESTPSWLIVDYHFPARSADDVGHGGFLDAGHNRNPGGPPVHLTWYHGGKKPPMIGKPPYPDWGAGNVFIGDKGVLLADYGHHMLFVDGKRATEFDRPKPYIPDSVGHHREWTAACMTGKPTTCHFGYAGPLTEAVLLGNVAYRTGKKLEWDASHFEVTNTRAADHWLTKTYRKGWAVL